MHIIPVPRNRAGLRRISAALPCDTDLIGENMGAFCRSGNKVELVKMGNQDAQESHYELRATSGPTAVSFPLSQPGPIVIGRMSSTDLQLNDASVSRQHARLTYRPPQEEEDAPLGEWLLGDLRSSRGTWLNGVKLNQNHQYRLRIGDLIVVGP